LLIIFDFDDTLIDTSGAVTPYQLQRAFVAMQNAGLVFSAPQKSLDYLLALDKFTQSAKETLERFLSDVDDSQHLFSVGKEALNSSLPENFVVPLRKNVSTTLQKLFSEHSLALVTMGKEEFQRDKLKKSGIDCSLFSTIAIARENEKKMHYAAIASKLQYQPEEVMVCGDRVVNDLIPAIELGFSTVHVEWGRGKNQKGYEKYVRYSIVELEELLPILQKFKAGFYDNE
jgi:FMN phosphatase YigB (HAD superfamily)